MLKENVNYGVKGYSGLWSVIDTYKGYALLENNRYGDETYYLVVRLDVEVIERVYTNKGSNEKLVIPTIMEVIEETFDDLESAVEEDIEAFDCLGSF